MNNDNHSELQDCLQTIPGLDANAGLTNLCGNIVQYHRLLVQIDEMFRDDMQQVAERLNQGQVKQVSSLVHSFKGAAGTLGLVTLFDCAINLERLLQSGQGVADRQTLQLARELGTGMESFHQHLASISPGP